MSGRSGGARICRRSPELTPELQGTAGPAPSPHARHPETSGRPRSSVLRAPLREPARSKLAALPCARVRHPRVGHPRPRHPRPHATAGVREEEADDNLVCFTRKQTQTRKQRSPWLGDRSQRSWGVLDPGKSAEDTGKGVRGEAVVAFAVARNRALFSSVCYLYRCSCCAAVARLCLALCAGTLARQGSRLQALRRPSGAVAGHDGDFPAWRASSGPKRTRQLNLDTCRSWLKVGRHRRNVAASARGRSARSRSSRGGRGRNSAEGGGGAGHGLPSEAGGVAEREERRSQTGGTPQAALVQAWLDMQRPTPTPEAGAGEALVQAWLDNRWAVAGPCLELHASAAPSPATGSAAAVQRRSRPGGPATLAPVCWRCCVRAMAVG